MPPVQNFKPPVQNLNVVRGGQLIARSNYFVYDRDLHLGRMRMVWNAINEWNQRRKLRAMLKDPWSARGFRSVGQLEKGIAADRPTTERLLRSIGARKAEGTEEWTLNPR